MLTGLDDDDSSMDNFELKTKNFERLFAGDSNAAGYADLGTMVNPRLLKSIFVSEDWIFILVDRIAQKLAQIPWQVNSRDVVNGEEVLKPELSHPVQKMLDNPNPLQDAYTFKYASIVDYSVTGNAIMYLSRQSNWLIQVPTEIIQPDITGRGELKGYDIVGMDPFSFPVSARTKLRPEDVIHVKRPNPSSVYWGLSPLIPGANPSLFNRYTNEYLLNFYRKGAQPGMILEMGEESNEVQAKKLLLTLETTYTGRTNQRRGMVLPKGVKASTIAHTLADQQLITYIQNNRETLINIYGVPKHELSLAESGSIGSEEYKTALKNFWEGPLMAIGSMFASAMTMRLASQLGPKYVIRLNYGGVPILQENLDDKALTANSMLATMTYNEVRQKIWKLPPIPGGDVLRDMRPMFPSFPDVPPTVTAPAAPAPVPVESGEDASDYRQQNVEAFSNYLKAEGNGWFAEDQAKLGEAANKNMAEVQKLFLKTLGDQVYAVARIVKEEVIEKAAEVRDERQLEARIDQAMKKLKSTWVKDYGTILEGQVELGYDTTVNVPFNKPYQEAIAAVSSKQKRRDSLNVRGIDAFEDVSRTTTNRIMTAVSQGIKQGKTVAEIAQVIRSIATLASGRANTIARTETLIANSIGQAAAMEDAASVIPKLVKVWINAGDNRVRGNPGGLYPNAKDDHWKLQGEVQDYDQDFSNGLRYPRDLQGGPEQTINCRCTWLTLAEKDAAEMGFKRK